jgi:hypothetical protein
MTVKNVTPSTTADAGRVQHRLTDLELMVARIVSTLFHPSTIHEDALRRSPVMSFADCKGRASGRISLEMPLTDSEMVARSAAIRCG